MKFCFFLDDSYFGKYDNGIGIKKKNKKSLSLFLCYRNDREIQKKKKLILFE